MTATGIISDGGSAFGLAKSGAGLFNPQGVNTYTGGFTIKSGTVLCNTSANACGATASRITLGDSTGSSDVTLKVGTLGIPNPITVASGSSGNTLTLTDNGSGGTFSGRITLNNNLTITSTNTSGPTFTGGIDGTGNITFTGSATISFSNVANNSINMVGTITNTNTGTIQINGGIGANVTAITENAANTFIIGPANGIVVNSATTTLTDTLGTITVSGPITGTGNLIFNNNKVSGVSNGVNITGTINNAGTITNSGTGTGLEDMLSQIGSNVTGIIQNSATSQLSLDFANTTYAGTTTIKSGTLRAGTSDSVLGSGTVVIGDSGGSAVATLLIGARTIANAITVASGSSGTLSLQVDNGSAGTFSGPIKLNNNLTITDVSGATANTVSGNISGTGNITIKSVGTDIITLSGTSINNAGSITNSGTGSAGNVINLISGVIGSNVTDLIQNSATDALNVTSNNSTVGNLSILAGGFRQTGSNNLNVSGNWTNNATFNAPGDPNTITFTSGTHTISGTTTFYNLTASSSNTLIFTNGTTQTVSNTFSCTGTPGNLITIKSTTPGSQATLSKSSGTVNCDYLVLTDSAATGGATWNAGSHSVGYGNVTGWTGFTTITTPAAPTGLTPTAGDTQVALSWTASSTGGSAITDYVIDYKLTSTSTWSTFADGVSTGTTGTVTGLTNGLDYNFRVSAVNLAGQGSASSQATSTPASNSSTVPDAPVIGTATFGNTQATVTFSAPASDGGSAITGYTVISSPAGGTDSNAGTTGLSHVVTGLSNGTPYTFTVTATNAIGTSSPSSPSNSVTPATVPNAPTSLTPTVGNTQISLTWTAPSNGGSAITDYTDEYKLTSTSTWSIFAHTPSTATSSTIVGLTNGLSYDFRVSAVNIAGQGSASATTTATPATTPDVPTIGTATAGNTQVSVTFTPSVSNGGSAITTYTVTSNTGGHTGSGTTSPIIVTGLSNGTHYTFTITATNVIGTSSASASSNDVVPLAPTFAPDPPTSVVATFGNTQATVTFSAPASDGGSAITGYTVISSPAGGTDSNAGTTGLSHVVTGLSNGTPYTFTVTATNAIGTSSPSSPSNSVTPATVPNAPTYLTPTVGNTQISLTWTAPGNNGGSAVTDYVLDFKLSASSSWSTFADGVSTTTNGTITGLINGSTYNFRVSAVNTVGQGNPSAQATSTPATVPDAPTSAVATGGNAQATITFAAPASTGGNAITNYTITSSPDNISTTTTTTTGVVTSLTNGTAYTFTVTATNGIGTGVPSAPSNSVTPATVPDAPTAVSGTVGNSQIALKWSAPVWNGGSAITDYVMEYKLTSTTTWSTFAHTPSTATSTTVTGLINGSSYDFRVSTVNSAGQGSPSSPISSTPYTVPDAPTSVVAIRGNTLATITFVTPAFNGGSTIISYTITSTPGSFSTTTTTTSGVVTGLTNGTAYTFKVTASNAAGTGAASVASNSVTPATVPDAPTSPTATPGNAQATITFTPPGSTGGSSITSYTVTSDPGSFTGSSSGSPITVTGLANGTSYNFTVTATNDVGTSTASTISNSVTPVTVPGAPTIGSATGGNAQATVTFSAPASDGGTPISSYTATSNPGNFTGSALSSPITVAGLTNGTSYTFTVTATNVVGTSSASAASNSVTPATVPDPPTGLSATPGNAQVGLSWVAPSVNGGATVSDYIIGYKLTSTSTWSTFADGVSAATTGTVTGLVNGSSYDFRVSTVNSAGQGSPSSIATAVPVTTPGAPTSVAATGGNAQATVTFSAPASDGGSAITSYVITSTPGSISTTTFTTSGIVTGLSNGTAYTFTVNAINAVGTGATSSPSNSVTPMTVPGAPTAVSAVGGNTQATVSFTAPASDGGSAITTYTVTSSPGALIGTGSTSPIVVSGLTNGNSYTFTVTATNAAGTSVSSSPSSPITLSTEPTAPLNLAGTVQGSSIGLSWSPPASNGGSAVTDYIVEYQLTVGGTWSSFADGVSTNTTATVIGLSDGTSYDFRVRAVNSIGQSLPSNSVSATPGEPAQVLIQSFPDLTNTNIGTAVRITNEGATGYEYQYTWCVTDAVDNLCGGGNDVFSSSAAKLIAAGQNFDTTLTSIVPNPGNYWFHIKVLYGSQSSSADQSFTAVATYPDAPTIGTATAGNTQATVSFTAPASNGGSTISGYTVTSSPGGLTGTGSSSPIVVTGLTNGIAYTFTVVATNVIGTGLSSSPSNIVTPATIPDPPTDVSAVAGNAQVALSWIAPVNNGGSAVSDYVIEYKLSSDSNWLVFADGVSSLTTATVTSLINDQSYDFRVSAVNSAGQSAVNSTSATLPEVVSPPSPVPSSGGSGGTGYVTQLQPPTNVPTNTVPGNVTANTPENIPENESTKAPVSQKSGTTAAPNGITPVVSKSSPTTAPSKNQVSATPTEHPVKSSGGGVPWIPIAVSAGLVIAGGAIFLIVRRRYKTKIDPPRQPWE